LSADGGGSGGCAATAGETDKHDQFQYWLAYMDEALEAFLDSLPEQCKRKLDGSAASLVHLEQMLLEKYPSLSEARHSSEKAFLDGAARYYGEILRQGTNSKWELQLDDKDSVFYGVPVLNGGRIEAVPICPLTNITALLSRRTGDFLKNAYARLAA